MIDNYSTCILNNIKFMKKLIISVLKELKNFTNMLYTNHAVSWGKEYFEIDNFICPVDTNYVNQAVYVRW